MAQIQNRVRQEALLTIIYPAEPLFANYFCRELEFSLPEHGIALPIMKKSVFLRRNI